MRILVATSGELFERNLFRSRFSYAARFYGGDRLEHVICCDTSFSCEGAVHEHVMITVKPSRLAFKVSCEREPKALDPVALVKTRAGSSFRCWNLSELESSCS